MSKYKIEKRKGIRTLIIKGDKADQICDNEVAHIHNEEVRGFIKMGIEFKGSAPRVFYDITGLLSLREALTAPLDKKSFCAILKDIVTTSQQMRKLYLNESQLELSIDYVMMNPVEQRLYYIYVPIKLYDTKTGLKEFLLDIISTSTFVSNEDNRYVSELIQLLNKGINFSMFELENYLNKLENDSQSKKDVKRLCPKCNSVIPKGAFRCQKCQAIITRTTTTSSSRSVDYVIDPFKQLEMSANSSSDQPEQRPQAVYNAGPRVERKSTGETVPITGEVFRMGSSKADNEYVISGNEGISRRHAKIAIMNGRYVLSDMGSTNGVFVRGIKLPSNKGVELRNGMSFKLANEEFIFRM